MNSGDLDTAMVCVHIARDAAPIGYAIREDSRTPGVSGWQFVCVTGDETQGLSETWALSRVLDHEPSLRGRLEAPVGTALLRDALHPGEWFSVQQGLP